jgi:hypothetical protein
MKRESINSGESQLNNDALLPLVDNMLKCRQEGFDRVNEKYGTNIKVELNSSWQYNEEAIESINDDEKKEETNPDGELQDS